MRIAHISDLHFYALSWKFSYLFSKKWVGYCNLLFKRRKEYSDALLPHFVSLLKKQNVSCVLITGDLSCIAREEEFVKAKAFLSHLETEGFKVIVLPGNHDKYTKQVCQNGLFYQFFDSHCTSDLSCSLKNDGVFASKLQDEWWLVGIDTAIATPLISSCGLFSSSLENNLRKTLQELPKGAHVILANHYPFFQHESKRKILKRGKALELLLKEFPQIRLYLHGHTHRHCLADLRASELPIVLDSGSLTHNVRSSWNLLEISPSGYTVQPFFKTPTATWEPKTSLVCSFEDK